MIKEAVLKSMPEEMLLGYLKIDISNAEEGVSKNLVKNINVIGFNFSDPEDFPKTGNEEEDKKSIEKIKELQNKIESYLLRKEHVLQDVINILRDIEVSVQIDGKEYSLIVPEEEREVEIEDGE